MKNNLEVLTSQVYEEILDGQQRRYPALSDREHQAYARQMTEVIMDGVVQMKNAPSLRQLQPPMMINTARLSPERAAQLAAVAATLHERSVESAISLDAQLRANREQRARSLFDGTAVSAMTVNAVIAALKSV